MPPRIPLQRLKPQPNIFPQLITTHDLIPHRHYAALATATTPASSIGMGIIPQIGIQRSPPTQPPSHRRPEFAKTQLLRQYISILRTCPITLVFQHNSTLATELSAIRTVMLQALQKVDKDMGTDYAPHIKLKVVRPGLLDAALRICRFWDPMAADVEHALSTKAYDTALKGRKGKHGMERLLSGPIAILYLPWSSPAHLKCALSLLAPNPATPAPKRRANPAYWQENVQSGVHKLMLLGARLEGETADVEKARWVANIPGGVDGLRAQLVNVLQGVGAGLTGALEAQGKSLYFTIEGRKTMMEEGEMEGEKKE